MTAVSGPLTADAGPAGPGLEARGHAVAALLWARGIAAYVDDAGGVWTPIEWAAGAADVMGEAGDRAAFDEALRLTAARLGCRDGRLEGAAVLRIAGRLAQAAIPAFVCRSDMLWIGAAEAARAAALIIADADGRGLSLPEAGRPDIPPAFGPETAHAEAFQPADAA